MEAEFLESDVMFSESDSDSDQSSDSLTGHNPSNKHKYIFNGHSFRKMKSSSIPLNIPDSPKRATSENWSDNDDQETDDGEIVPPHLIVARRRSSAKMESSLRGRNLCQVRNSILRMTGFLES